MKKLLKIGVVLSSALLVPVAYVVYLWFGFIGETITSGEAYGFTIGDTKQEVIDKASKLYQSDRISYRRPQFPSDQFKTQLLFTSEQREELLRLSDWAFYFGMDLNNSIGFSFDSNNDTLMTILRHRQHFEFP